MIDLRAQPIDEQPLHRVIDGRGARRLGSQAPLHHDGVAEGDQIGVLAPPRAQIDRRITEIKRALTQLGPAGSDQLG